MSAMTRPALYSLLAALALAACGGSSSEPREPATATTAAASTSVQAQCEAFFARARECSEPYIGALVDVRIELDRPPGVADQARTEGRDALVAKAMEEWATDSQPENVSAMCEESAAKMPPEQSAAMMTGAQRCMAEAACDAFATCSKDLHRTMLGPH
jgi:hypothetical protein